VDRTVKPTLIHAVTKHQGALLVVSKESSVQQRQKVDLTAKTGAAAAAEHSGNKQQKKTVCVCVCVLCVVCVLCARGAVEQQGLPSSSSSSSSSAAAAKESASAAAAVTAAVTGERHLFLHHRSTMEMNHHHPQQMMDGDEQQHQQQHHQQEGGASSQSLIIDRQQDLSGGTAAVDDPFLRPPPPQPPLPLPLPSQRPGNITTNKSVKHHPRRRPAATAATATSFHSYLQQAMKAPPSNVRGTGISGVGGGKDGAAGAAADIAVSSSGVAVDGQNVDYASFKSLLRNFRRRRRKIRRALLLRGQLQNQQQQHRQQQHHHHHHNHGRQHYQAAGASNSAPAAAPAATCLPIEEFELLVLLKLEEEEDMKRQQTFPVAATDGECNSNHHPQRAAACPDRDIELGPVVGRTAGRRRRRRSNKLSTVVTAETPSYGADPGGSDASPAPYYFAMVDEVAADDDDCDCDDDFVDVADADDGGIMLDVESSNDDDAYYIDMSDNTASRFRGRQRGTPSSHHHHHRQQQQHYQPPPPQVPPSVIYTPTPQAGNLTLVATATTTTSVKEQQQQQQKFNFNTLSGGRKRRRAAIGVRNPSPFSAVLLSPFENRRSNLNLQKKKMISRREMTRRLANLERQEIIDFLDHELERTVSPAYDRQYERLTTKFIGLQQQDFDSLQHRRQNLVVLGKELLDMYAFCTITVVVVTQILQKYDAFARAYEGIPMMQYYMKNITTREGNDKSNNEESTKAMTSFFYRRILHPAEVEAMFDTYKNILISSISTTSSSSEGNLDTSRLAVHLSAFETEQFFIHDIVSAARDVATSSSPSPSAPPNLHLSPNLPSSSPISLGYVPPTTPTGTSRPVRMSSPTFHHTNDTASTYERAMTGIKSSLMKLQHYFLLGYGGEDRMIGYYSSLPLTRHSKSSSGIVTMTGLMSDLARWRVESDELWSEILVMTTDPENLAAVTHQGVTADSLNSLTCFSNPFEMIANENDDEDDRIVYDTSTKTSSDKDNDPNGSHPTSDQEGQFSKQELFNLGLCLSSAGLYCLNYYIVEPSSTMYVNALGADDAVSALLIGMMPIASFGAAIVYSVWTNKAFRTPFIASCTLMLVGNIVYSLAFNFRSLPMALIGRFMTGLGGPKCIIRRYMADTTTMQQRTSVNALFGMVVAAGSALGPGCAILLNRLDFVVELPLMFRGLLRRDGGPGDEDVGSVSLFVNGMTGPGWFMAGMWTLFTTCFFAMFREIPRVGLQQQLQKERQQVIATNVSRTPNEDLKTNEESLQKSNRTASRTVNCSNVNLVVYDSRSMVGNCNSFHNPNGGEGYIDDLATLMSGKTNTTSSSSIGNQSLMTMSINDDTFDDEFDSDDDYDGDYHGYASQNQCDDRNRYFDRDRLAKAFAVITKPILRSFRSLLKIWNAFSRSCSRITLSVQLCLGLLFAKVFVIETLVSCTSALSKNRYGWTIKQVGMLGCFNGLSVIPLSIFVGRLSMTLQDRLLMICLICVGVSGLCLLIDVSDIRMAFGVPEENPDAVDVGGYNSGRVFAVGPLQYVIGYFLTYVSIQSFEGVIGSTLSKVIPTKLATGTFNSGLLATLVDTSGRFSGDIFISVMAMINMRQLMNLLFVPGLLILLTCLIVVRRYYDLLAV